MNFEYGLDTDTDIHLLSFLKWMTGGLVHGKFTFSELISRNGDRFAQIYDFLLNEFDDKSIGVFYANLENFIDTIGNLLRNPNSLATSEYSQTWENLKAIYLGDSFESEQC
jgi:hypothetical protein